MVTARHHQASWIHGSQTFGLSCFSRLATVWRPVGDPPGGNDATDGERVGGGRTLVPLRRTREWGAELWCKITVNAGMTASGGVWRVQFSTPSPRPPSGSLVPGRFPSGGGHFPYRNPPNRQTLTTPLSSSTALSHIVANQQVAAGAVYLRHQGVPQWQEI